LVYFIITHFSIFQKIHDREADAWFVTLLFTGAYGSDFALPSPSRVKFNTVTMKSYSVVIPVMMEWKILETLLLMLHILKNIHNKEQ
jgi:hypothetical protein